MLAAQSGVSGQSLVGKWSPVTWPSPCSCQTSCWHLHKQLPFGEAGSSHLFKVPHSEEIRLHHAAHARSSDFHPPAIHEPDQRSLVYTFPKPSDSGACVHHVMPLFQTPGQLSMSLTTTP